MDIKPARILISDCYFFNNNAALAEQFISLQLEQTRNVSLDTLPSSTIQLTTVVLYSCFPALFTTIRSCFFRHNAAKYNGGAVNIPEDRLRLSILDS